MTLKYPLGVYKRQEIRSYKLKVKNFQNERSSSNQLDLNTQKICQDSYKINLAHSKTFWQQTWILLLAFFEFNYQPKFVTAFRLL